MRVSLVSRLPGEVRGARKVGVRGGKGCRGNSHLLRVSLISNSSLSHREGMEEGGSHEDIQRRACTHTHNTLMYPHTHASTRLSIHPRIYPPPTHPPSLPSIHPATRPPIHPPSDPPTHPSIHPPTHPHAPSLPRTHAQGVSHEDNTRKSLLVTRDAAHVWTGDDGGHVIIWDSQVCPARMGDSDG